MTQKICLFISCSLAYLRTDIRLNAPAKLIFIWYEGTFEGTFEVQARTYYEGISRQTKYVNIEKDPFTRGACAEASAGAITCIIWCNTSQYTPLQALSPRPRAAALIPSSPSLGNLRKSFASDVNFHVSNPRVPSPAAKAKGR